MVGTKCLIRYALFDVNAVGLIVIAEAFSEYHGPKVMSQANFVHHFDFDLLVYA